MSLTIERWLPAFLLALMVLTWAEPITARAADRTETAASNGESSTAHRLALYSPHLRRSTIMYLRLRLLELREAGLERARSAIERRLSIDELLAEPTPAPATKIRRSSAVPAPQ